MLERKVNLESGKKSFGLTRTLFYSAIFGISIGLAYRSGVDFAEAKTFFLFSDLLSIVEPAVQGLIMLVAIALAFLSIFRLSRFFTKIYEQKRPGIFTAFLGFTGSILIVLAPQSSIHFILVGIGFWIIGIIVVGSLRNS